jgi:hypothetical protein
MASDVISGLPELPDCPLQPDVPVGAPLGEDFAAVSAAGLLGAGLSLAEAPAPRAIKRQPNKHAIAAAIAKASLALRITTPCHARHAICDNHIFQRHLFKERRAAQSKCREPTKKA